MNVFTLRLPSRIRVRDRLTQQRIVAAFLRHDLLPRWDADALGTWAQGG